MDKGINLRMVRECYQMIELLEKQDFRFKPEDRRLLLGYAFHQRDLDCIHDAVINIATLREGTKGELDAGVIRQYSAKGGNELQEKIVDYIVQLEVANVNQERANRLLEQLLREKQVEYELDKMLADLRRREESQKKEAEVCRR